MAKKKKKVLWWIIGTILALVVLFFILSAVAVLWDSRHPANPMPTVSQGRLELYPHFRSKFVPSRDIAVWTPEDYRTGDSCDVIYMHDGQMLFDATTTWNHQEWQVDEKVDTLIKAGSIRRCIIVGIYNTDNRLNEYFPDKTWLYVPEDARRQTDTTLFQGDEYLQFIVNELKPFIDERYRPLTTKEHTFMMGSSMGGLISLYALCEYPQVFGGVAYLSTHLSMAHLENDIDDEAWPAAFRNYVDKHLPEANSSLIYLDQGTKDFDADYAPHFELLQTAIAAKGWDQEHCFTTIAWGAGHNEKCWARRLPQSLTFLLGTEREQTHD